MGRKTANLYHDKPTDSVGQDNMTNINDGWDPEATRTVKGGKERYPFNRTFTVGLNATF